jgi:hypothetical protein
MRGAPDGSSRASSWLALALLLLAAPNASAAVAAGASQAPVGRVENVRFEIAEGGIVRVFYDLLADNPQQLVGVILSVSQDAGKTFEVTAASVTGDVGAAVLPGPGKQIVWEAARDVERLDATALRLRIMVTIAGALLEPPSFWGVGGSFAPTWTTSSKWGERLFNAQLADFGGSEFRVGIVRGRSGSGDWGVSLVRKRLKTGSTVVRDLSAPGSSTTTYRAIADVWSTGVEVHGFLPFLSIGRDTQIGVILAGGVANNFSGTVQRQVEGPIHANSPYEGGPLIEVPQGPGFIVDDRGNVIEVGPGETVARDDVVASNLYRVSGWDVPIQVLGRAELAVAFDVRPGVRLRASGGFNFPGFPAFSVEMVYFPGVPALER